MKKSTLNISILMLAWIALVTPVVTHAGEPVKLPVEIIDALKEALPKVDVEKIVTEKMKDLYNNRDVRFNSGYLPCIRLVDCEPMTGAQYLNLNTFLPFIKKFPLPKWKESQIELFCEGYNDGIRFAKNECSVPQVIYNCLDSDSNQKAYPCGVNEAMAQMYKGKIKFPWSEKKYYAKPAKK